MHTGETYFLFESDKLYFGILEARFNPKETAFRDMKKPERRESLAISPNLSKILINLSQAKPSGNLLDPFCGVGVIIQEALLQNINSIGVDLNPQATSQAKTNIAWLNKTFKITTPYKIITQDSRVVLPMMKVLCGIQLKSSPKNYGYIYRA